MSDITRILSQIASGDPSAAEQLLPLVYDELRKLAAARMAQEKSDLTLQATGFVAGGQTIELEDFTLKMIDGTFFLNTQEAGPTALVFVGKGQVTFKPRPVTERGQMKIFAKSEVLEDEVSRAFLRIHPADLYRTLVPGSFVDDPQSASRLARAAEYFERHKTDAFMLDASVAGAPWWLLPGLGDAAIAFDTKRFGSLTLSLSSFDAEGVSLFNRSTQRQISAYPRASAGDQPVDDDSGLDVDALGGAPDMLADPKIQSRAAELASEAQLTLQAIRNIANAENQDALVDPAVLAKSVLMGILDAPQLRSNPYGRGEISTRIVNGACLAVKPDGSPLCEAERLAAYLPMGG